MRKWSLDNMPRTLHHSDVVELLVFTGFAEKAITGRSNRRQHVMWFFTATRSDDQQAVQAIIDMGDHKLEVQAILEARRKAQTRETRALQPERRVSFEAPPPVEDPLAEVLYDDSFECWNPCDEDYPMEESTGEDCTMGRKRTKAAVDVVQTATQRGKNASKQARKEHWIPRGTIIANRAMGIAFTARLPITCSVPINWAATARHVHTGKFELFATPKRRDGGDLDWAASPRRPWQTPTRYHNLP